MDNLSHSRILEPIDPNSLSLISSSSGSNLCSSIQDGSLGSPFGMTEMPPVVESEGVSTVKWQYDRKEFEFESNSTPSKTANPQHQKILHVRKRRSQLMGAKPRIPSKLYQSSSKLDLLDEKILTSFPIPPPLDVGGGHNVKKVKLNPINEIRIHNDKENRRISYGVPQKLARHREEDEMDEHQMVLVEDYIPFDEGLEKNMAKKKVSISNLRTKMSKRSDINVPLRFKNLSRQDGSKTPSSSLTLVPHIMDENFLHEHSACSLDNDTQTLQSKDDEKISQSFQHILQDLIKSDTTEENDRYLSGLRINSKLKKCVVCEKPLYEISSLISEGDNFKEIVCGKCTARYEEAAKIFENYEFESSGESSNDTTTSSMGSPVDRSHLEDLDMSSTNNWKPLKSNFSDELIKRLKLQSGLSTSERKERRQEHLDCGTIIWFMEAKKRITRFLTNQYKADSRHISS